MVDLQAAVIAVVDFLDKSGEGRSRDEIEVETNVVLTAAVEAKLRALATVTIEDGLYYYRRAYQICSLRDLEEHVRARPAELTELAEIAAPDVLASIDTSSRLFVVATKTTKYVFANADPTPCPLPQLFRDEFFRLKVPDDVDLERDLTKAGIFHSPAAAPAPKPKKQRRKEKPKRIKITNLHLAGTALDINRIID